MRAGGGWLCPDDAVSVGESGLVSPCLLLQPSLGSAACPASPGPGREPASVGYPLVPGAPTASSQVFFKEGSRVEVGGCREVPFISESHTAPRWEGWVSNVADPRALLVEPRCLLDSGLLAGGAEWPQAPPLRSWPGHRERPPGLAPGPPLWTQLAPRISSQLGTSRGGRGGGGLLPRFISFLFRSCFSVTLITSPHPPGQRLP